MEKAILIAKTRSQQGSSHARRIRKAGQLPGVIYSEGGQATAIELDMHGFEQMLHHHASESMLANVELDSEGRFTVLVKEVQHHPVTSELLHVDLMKVSMDKPIEVEVPLELVGEAVGVKAGGILDHLVHAVTIKCLPGDLVEMVEVDVSGMAINDVLTVNDIKIDRSKYTLLDDGDMAVASVSLPRVEEEQPEAAVQAEPEVITEKKAAEQAEGE